MGTANYDFLYSVSVGSDGTVAIAGHTDGSLAGTNAGSYDAYVRKFDGSGTVLWTRQFGTAGIDAAFSVSVGSDGSVLVAGDTQGNLGGTEAGAADAYVRKYDAGGTVLWTQQFGTASNDAAYSASEGSDSGTIVTGITQGSLGGASAGAYDAFVMRLVAP